MSDAPPGPPSEERPGENVLILGPVSDGGSDAACARQLLDSVDEDGAFILVTLVESPERRVEVIRAPDDRLPAHVTVVCTAESRQGSGERLDGVDLRTIDTPSDLARLGVLISNEFSGVADQHPTAICFHSLTALLQFVELSRVFRFVYTLGQRVADGDARVHYHLDPDAHDDQTVATLRPLFDTVVHVSDGEYRPPEIGDGEPAEDADGAYDAWDQLMDGEP